MKPITKGSTMGIEEITTNVGEQTGTYTSELNSMQSTAGNITDPVLEKFQKALDDIQAKIDAGKTDEARELIEKEIREIQEQYVGCYLFKALAEFKAALNEYQKQLEMQ